MWLGINAEESLIKCHSVDAKSILPFLRGRDFQIVEMWGRKNDKNLLREGEERVFTRHNHYIEISALLEVDDLEQISSLIINFDNGDRLNFCLGQLSVRLSDNISLRKSTVKLLEQYGYFAADKIWDYVIKQDYDMPIYYVLGMENKDLNNSLNRMRDEGIRVAEFHTKFKS